MNDVVYRFTSKIEFITGSRKFRTRAQWPVDIMYTVDENININVHQVIWDKCNGDRVDITEFIMPDQLTGLENEIDELFWIKETKKERKLNDDN